MRAHVALLDRVSLRRRHSPAACRRRRVLLPCAQLQANVSCHRLAHRRARALAALGLGRASASALAGGLRECSGARAQQRRDVRQRAARLRR